MNISSIAQTRHTAKAFDATRRIPEAQLAELRALLCATPSSVNSQPWHFVMAGTPEGRARIAKAVQGPNAYNEAKVLNASHVVVLCVKPQLDDAHLKAVLEAEEKSGRFANAEARETQDKVRRYYVGLHRNELKDEAQWAERQVYIGLGALLLGAGAMGLDACPMEGFDRAVLDEELGLTAKGLSALVVVALGYHSEADFNARLPKSRLAEAQVFTEI